VKFCKANKIEFLKVSAKTGEFVEDAFLQLCREMISYKFHKNSTEIEDGPKEKKLSS